MSWVRFENNIGEHPKCLELADELYLPALGLLLVIVAWCDAHRTDGHIPAKAIRRICPDSYDAELDELVRVGFLEAVPPVGYYVHDYTDWQRSREQIDAASDKARKGADSMHRKRHATSIATSIARGTAPSYAEEDREEDKKMGGVSTRKQVSRAEVIAVFVDNFGREPSSGELAAIEAHPAVSS